MYPLNQPEPYPRNQWYVAAWRNEIGRTLFERRILDEPVVFYRTEAGDPVALAGLCPHRLYPLREGRLVGDRVECGYHGFTFDCTGACVDIPSQTTVPSRFATRRFPVVDRWEWTWIWMGDPALADESRIPPIESIGLGAVGWRADAGVLTPLGTRFSLLLENLMDLSHVSFAHAKSLPGSTSLAAIPATISEEGEILRVDRKLPTGPLEGFGAHLHPDLSGTICEDRIVSDYFGPALVRTGGRYIVPVSGGQARAFNFIHGVTPETSTTTHYFNAIARNFRLDDDDLSHGVLAQMKRVIDEDVIVLNTIEAYVDRHAATERELSCQADVGALRVRRKLAAQVAAEATLAKKIVPIAPALARDGVARP
ncbi:Rieske 2Fe-2S domain-containing protein [Caballeronia sp. HLA56]